MSNVFGFGAVGDGITDDTESLQHAIDSGDGALRLNKGPYRITQPLVIDLTKRILSSWKPSSEKREV